MSWSNDINKYKKYLEKFPSLAKLDFWWSNFIFWMSWWNVIFGTQFWSKSQSLTFLIYNWLFPPVDQISSINPLVSRDELKYTIRSKWRARILEIMLPTNNFGIRSKNQNSVIFNQNPNFSYFALLIIWMIFLENCDPRLETWQKWSWGSITIHESHLKH